jgi:hypothetical protein
MLLESEFKPLRDSTYVFGTPNRFVWPYIVTAGQKAAIERWVLRPYWFALVATPALGVSLTALTKSPAALLAAAVVLVLVLQWPRIWVLLRLRQNNRIGAPFLLWNPESDRDKFEFAIYGRWPRASLIAVLILSGLFAAGCLWLLLHGFAHDAVDSAEEVRAGSLGLVACSYLLLAAGLLWMGRPDPSRIVSGASVSTFNTLK